jgi:hypothetical protein
MKLEEQVETTPTQAQMNIVPDCAWYTPALVEVSTVSRGLIPRWCILCQAISYFIYPSTLPLVRYLFLFLFLLNQVTRKVFFFSHPCLLFILRFFLTSVECEGRRTRIRRGEKVSHSTVLSRETIDGIHAGRRPELNFRAADATWAI